MMKLSKLVSMLALGLACSQSYANNWYNTTIVASGTYTSSFASSDVIQNGGMCAHIIVNVTSISGAMVPHIEGKDQLMGNYYDILVGSPITDTGATVLKVCPSIPAMNGVAASDMLPYNWRIEFFFKGSTSATFSVEDNYDQ